MRMSRMMVIFSLSLCAGLLTTALAAESQDPAEDLLSFMAVYRGFFSNVPQIILESLYNGTHLHDVVELLFLPVDVPAFKPDYTFFIEEDVNGKVFRLHVAVIKLGKDGSIDIFPYNFTDVSKYKPHEFNISSLQKMPRSDFTMHNECFSNFQRIDKKTFVGAWSNCREETSGHPVQYAITLTCDAWLTKVQWGTSEEKPQKEDYRNQRLVANFPLTTNMLKGAKDNLDPCGAPYASLEPANF